MIKIKQLGFHYKGSDRPALKNIDLNVQAKTILGLLGPNGAGKTTLLSIISGLLPCPAETVFFDDRDISIHHSAPMPNFSLVPQDYAFYLQLTVIENLSFFAGAQGLDKTLMKVRIDEVTEITSLGVHLEQKAVNLSGGLKRRLNLAIGLLNKPQLLLLDEPTVGIDPHSRHFILEAIKDINREGTTIIYTSHYMEEVEALCDEIAIVDNGAVILQGSLQELLQKGGGQSLCVDLGVLPRDEQLKALSKTLSFKQDVLRLNIIVNSVDEVVEALRQLNEQQLDIGRIHYGTSNLEELFLDLTQRSLRD